MTGNDFHNTAGLIAILGILLAFVMVFIMAFRLSLELDRLRDRIDRYKDLIRSRKREQDKVWAYIKAAGLANAYYLWERESAPKLLPLIIENDDPGGPPPLPEDAEVVVLEEKIAAAMPGPIEPGFLPKFHRATS